VSQCQYFNCDDGGDCQFENDYYPYYSCDGADGCTDRYRESGDGEDGDYQMCETGDSGCVYTCEDDSCTLVSSNGVCAEGDEECREYYEYYEGEGNDNGDEGSHGLSRFLNVAFYLIPVLLLTLLFACCMHRRVSTTERRRRDIMI
jgi:hypothetical protein